MTSPATRNAPVWVTVLLAVLAVLLIVVGIIYLVEPAQSLPAFFPGHQHGIARHHTKHGLVALALALLALVGAWLTTGSRRHV